MTIRAISPDSQDPHPEPPELAVPPRPPTRDARIQWLAELLASGRYARTLVPVIAEAWALSPRTVQHDIELAGKFVSYAADDLGRLRQLCAVRLEGFARDSALEPRDRLKAIELQLKCAGVLRGGTTPEPTLTPEQRATAIVESLRDPDEQMAAWLRMAFLNPGDELRALLREFTGKTPEGTDAGSDQ